MKLFCWCCVGGRVCIRCVGLHVIAEKMKVYSYIHVGKKSVSTRYFLNTGQIPSVFIVEFMYSHDHRIRGAGLLNIHFVKQYLY
jgi:hypothetical protein